MSAAIGLADRLDVEAVLEMHRVLMEGEERHTPGRFRTEPVRIGRSSFNPIDADFVAPRFERVPDLVDDVMAFARCNDVPVLAQTAIAHAQFETIHPFTDGNGRTGRALMQAMLRAGDLTRSVTVPVSAGLLADVDAYHRAHRLPERRPAPIVRLTAESAIRAIKNATILIDDLRAIRARWNDAVRVRSDSAANRVLDLALRQPVFDAATVSRELSIPVTNAYRAVPNRAGALWRAEEVLRALDAFAERSGRRAHRVK